MMKYSKFWMVVAPLSLVLVLGACDDDDNGLTGVDEFQLDLEREYNQIERLGNPLTSEALLDKRFHGFHNTTGPSTDVANFRDNITTFVTQVAGRDQQVAETIATVLLPDMLLVFPNRASGVSGSGVGDAATVGWLTWALAPGEGYGGRKLDNDDAVDKLLSAGFGSLLSEQNVSPGLATDNVPDMQIDHDGEGFPYVQAPN